MSSLDKQFSDLFRKGLLGKKQIMQNPFNVQFLLNKYFEDEVYTDIKKKIKKCIDENIAFKTDDHEINSILRNEVLIMERLKDLRVRGLDFKEKTTMVAKHGNINIFKLVIDLGADINYRNKEGNTALSIAFKHGSKALVNWIWSQPKLDRSEVDNEGVSYGVLAYTHQKYEIAKDIFNESPEQFANISNKKKSLLHVIKSVRNECAKKKIRVPDLALTLEEKIVNYLYENYFELFNLQDERSMTAIDNNNFDMKIYMTKKLNDKMLDELEDKGRVKALKI